MDSKEEFIDWTRPLTLKEQADTAFISKLTGLFADEINKLKKRILIEYLQKHISNVSCWFLGLKLAFIYPPQT